MIKECVYEESGDDRRTVPAWCQCLGACGRLSLPGLNVLCLSTVKLHPQISKRRSNRREVYYVYQNKSHNTQHWKMYWKWSFAIIRIKHSKEIITRLQLEQLLSYSSLPRIHDAWSWAHFSARLWSCFQVTVQVHWFRWPFVLIVQLQATLLLQNIHLPYLFISLLSRIDPLLIINIKFAGLV